MQQRPYTPNELYRRLHTGSQTDVEFYLRAVQDAVSVLECGCGWGRISLPLVQAGYAVTAVDLEGEFLEELGQTARRLSCAQGLTIHQQDITCLDLPLAAGQVQKFDRILIPYNTLYALGGAAKVLQCFQHVARHLKADGELWFDLYDMDTFHEQYDPTDDVDDNEPVATWNHEGEVEVFEHTVVLHDTKRLTVTYSARATSSHRALGQLTMFHDYLLSTEVEDLLTGAELELLGRYDHPLQEGERLSSIQADMVGSNETETSGPVFYCVGLSNRET